MRADRALNRLARARRELRGAAPLILVSAVYPYAVFLAANRSSALPVGRLAAYAVATAMVLLAVCGALLVVFRRARGGQLAVAAAVFVLLFFNYSALVRAAGGVATIWFVSVVVGLPAAYLLARAAAVRLYALVVVVLLTAVPGAQYVAHALSAPDAAGARPAQPGRALGNLAEKPNIWFFMLDGYARGDQFRRVLDHDNSGFTTGLRDRGFAVNEHSYSSYTQTIGSVPSMLDMGYPATGRVRGGEKALIPILRGENRLVRTLKASGYRYVHGEPGTWEANQCRRSVVDLCVAPRRGAGIAAGEVEQSLISSTPLRRVLRRFGVRAALDSGFTTPGHVVDAVAEARQMLPEPYFVFSHQLSPHPPFRFRADCSSYVTPVGELTLWDSRFKTEYLAEVECLNRRMLEAVDRITDDDPNAVIVILSDHGTGFGLNLVKPARAWTTAELDQRFAVFSAVRLPSRCPQDETSADFTVNTFRRVLACLERRDPQLVRYRSFVVREENHSLEMDEVRRRDWPREPTPSD